MRQTTLNSEVIVIVDGKPLTGKIVEVFSQGAARIQLGDKSSIQASYSSKGEEGTFHYSDEAEAVKKAQAAAGKTETQPDAAAPATGSGARA
jgi:hypothetical protein